MFLVHTTYLLVVCQIYTEDIFIFHPMTFMEKAANNCTGCGVEIAVNVLNVRIPLTMSVVNIKRVLGSFGKSRVKGTIAGINIIVTKYYCAEHRIHGRQHRGYKKKRNINMECDSSDLRQIQDVCCTEEASNPVPVNIYFDNEIDSRNDSGLEKIIYTLQNEIYCQQGTITTLADVTHSQFQNVGLRKTPCLKDWFSESKSDAGDNSDFEIAKRSSAWRRKLIFHVLHFLKRDELKESWTPLLNLFPKRRLNFSSKPNYIVCLHRKNHVTLSNFSQYQIYNYEIILFFRYILEIVIIIVENCQSIFRRALMESKNQDKGFNLLEYYSCDMSQETFKDFSHLEANIKYTTLLFILLMIIINLCIDKFGDVKGHIYNSMMNFDSERFTFRKMLGEAISNYKKCDTLLQEKGIEFCSDSLKMTKMRRLGRNLHINTDDPSFMFSLRQNEYFEGHDDQWESPKTTQLEYKIKSIPWYLRLQPLYIKSFATILPLSLKEYVLKKLKTQDEHRTQLMKYEWKRYKSFQNFPSSSPIQGIRLAQAGFYYSNVADEATCFSCGIKCRGWQYGDLPKERHTKMSPACSFISGLSDNIPIADEERTQAQCNTPLCSRDPHTQVEDKVDSSHSESTRNSSPDFSTTVLRNGCNQFGASNDLHSGLAFESIPGNFVLHHGNEDNGDIIENRDENRLLSGFGNNAVSPRYPQYSVLRHRVESFTSWPIYAEQDPKVLANAGLFYTGSSDCVRCFQCGGGLRSWQRTDIPWNEHAHWYPDCSFVLRCKGREFIEQALYQRETPDVSDTSQYNQNDHGASSPESTNKSKEDVLHTEPVQTVLEMGFPVDIVKTAVKSLQERQSSRSYSAADLLEVLLHENNVENDLGRASSKPNPGVRSFIRNIIEGSEETPDRVEKETIPCKDKEVLDGRRKDATIAIDGKDSETSATPLSEKDYKSLMEENILPKNQMTCKICMDAEASIVFLPCSHMMTCSKCASAFRKCPICRQTIRGTVRAYL